MASAYDSIIFQISSWCHSRNKQASARREIWSGKTGWPGAVFNPWQTTLQRVQGVGETWVDRIVIINRRTTSSSKECWCVLRLPRGRGFLPRYLFTAHLELSRNSIAWLNMTREPTSYRPMRGLQKTLSATDFIRGYTIYLLHLYVMVIIGTTKIH